jgi:superfamily II DNA or RNA helicase
MNLEIELKRILKERNLEFRDNFKRNILDYQKPTLPHVLAAATSSGKTYLTAAKFELYYKCGILKKTDKVLILASSLTILRDNFDSQFKEFDVKSFTYQVIEHHSELKEAYKNNIQVLITIPQTIIKHTKLLKNVKWLVVDEAHNWYNATTVRQIIKDVEPKYQFLLTGTPFKFNARKEEFIIDYTSVRELYEAKMIDDVQLKVLHSSVQLTQLDYTKILGHLKENKTIVKGDLVHSLNEVIKQLIKILGLIKKNWNSINNISQNYISVFGKMEKTIIYTNGKTECDCVYECLKLNKVNVLKSHSSDDQDAVETFRLFKEDDSIKVLVVVNRGKEGFNFPELYNIIDFSYTQDFATTLQMIGRLLRKSNGKIQKVFYKVAPKNTSLYFMDWMNYVIQLFDNEQYERYNGRNAREMRVPNQLLSSNQPVNRTNRTINTNRQSGPFNPRNLNETGMLSLSFMEQNKWFKSNDYLSVVGTTSLDTILKKYKLLKRIEFLPLENCLKFVHKLKIETNEQWDEYCLSGKKPENIPANYRLIFGIKTGEWLGTGRISDWEKEFKSISELRTLCKELGITSKTKWFDYWKKNKRPSDVPSNPISTYKNEINGWIEFFNKNIRTNNTITWSFKKSRKFVRALKLKGTKGPNGWSGYCLNGNIPLELPRDPSSYYSKLENGKEWTNWKDFLGDETMRTPNKKN